jgi:hypothetical protein
MVDETEVIMYVSTDYALSALGHLSTGSSWADGPGYYTSRLRR